MKKNILILSGVLVTFSLLAYGVIDSKDSVTDQEIASNIVLNPVDKEIKENFNVKAYPDFAYDVGSRFMSTITKEDLHKAKSLLDFLPKEQTDPVFRYKSVSVIILDDFRQTDKREIGYSEVLTDAQIKLLQSTDYSTNFLIRADFQEMSSDVNHLVNNYFTPHMTVVPENEAVYVNGKDALIDYLKENSKEKTTIVNEKKVKSGKIFFTVTKEGDISNVNLTSTSGYPSIDLYMIELIKSIPGAWEAASNSIGQKVDQELVFSFGTIGC
ncbi:MAG: hypothetical protein ACI83B_000807 [Sediminicola sp.]|jgi:hypothetical protein|tara:strand:+ start:1581 stop:2390 length:810 start_codon:yes stop_codon:yes gene_type:complete